MPNLQIIINNKVATYVKRGGAIVCGNSGYVVEFAFDQEWDAYQTKTARFIWGGKYHDVDFEGTTCPVPVVRDTTLLSVGVYAGNLCTTTPALIGCERSILCGGEPQSAGSAEQYTNEAKVAADRAEAAADAAAEAAVQRFAERSAEQQLGGIVQTTGDSETQVMSQKSVGVLCENILKDAIDLIRFGEVTYSLRFTNHAINRNTGEQSAASDVRASTPHLYYVPKGCEYSVVRNSGYNGDIYAFSASGEFLGTNIHTDEVAYVRILTIKSDNTVAITPEEAVENTSLKIICKDTFKFLEQEINKTKGYFVNDNLLCSAEYRERAYWNELFTDSPYYNVFYTIPVKSGVKYIIKPRARFVVTKALSDGSGALVDRLASGNHTEYTPSGDGYMYLSMYVDDSEDDYAFYEEGKTAIAPYNKVFLSDKVETPNATNEQASTDILYGKKWAPLGDSFTHGSRSALFTEGRYTGKPKTYPYFIGNRADMEILSQFFSGGRTLAYPSDGTFTNSVTCPTASCYYQNIPEDTDYVTIYLGINDSHHEGGNSGTDGEDVTGVIPLGTIDDSDTSTYYGAWNVVLTWLRENRPFTHVGILVSNGCDRAAYRTAQLEIAKKHGVPFIDLNGDERTPVMIRSMNTDIASAVRNAVTRKQAVDYDGSVTGSVNTHPNDDAHEFESHFIENFLRSL